MSVHKMNSLQTFLNLIVKKKYEIVRVIAGLFSAYFFYFYFESIETVYLFRSKSEINFLNNILNGLGASGSLLLLKAVLIFFFFSSFCFVLGYFTRLNALLIWAGYLFFYNFFMCINQPHITYFIYVLMTYVFLSNELFFSNKQKEKYFDRRFLFILTFVYMCQMSVSGFSKALSPEWLAGDIIKILSNIRDPEPGILWVGVFPEYVLKFSTWLVLVLECMSFLYLIYRPIRFYIWMSHVLMYLSIIVLVPYATHVAFTMLLFNILILDSKIIPQQCKQ